MRIPLIGLARYTGTALKWEVLALAETHFSGTLFPVQTLQQTMNILPFRTIEREEVLRLALEDPPIRELVAELRLPDPTDAWSSLCFDDPSA
jgi:hypothetical protein